MAAEGTNYRTRLIAAVTFIGGLYFVLEFILPPRLLDAIGVSAAHERISYGFITVGAMALGLGLINLFMIHGSRIFFRKKGALYSAALLSGLLLMMYLSFADWLQSLHGTREVDKVRLLSRFASKIVEDAKAGRADVPPIDVRVRALAGASAVARAEAKISAQAVQSATAPAVQSAAHEVNTALQRFEGFECRYESLEQAGTLLNGLAVARGKLERALQGDGVTSKLFHFLRDGMFVSLGSAMFSLLAFYIAAAAYRAFRIKSWESALMMLAALIVMCGQMSFTLRLFGGFAEWRGWLMDVPNSAAFRAIRIGAAVAGLILAFRMWFSIESESFSERGQ